MVHTWSLIGGVLCILVIIAGNPATSSTSEETQIIPGLLDNNTEYPTTYPPEMVPITKESTIGAQYGWVIITSHPSGAMVSFDGASQGRSPVKIRILSTLSPFHQVFISMDGYRDWSTSLTENPKPGETITINADLIQESIQTPHQTPTITPSSSLTPRVTLVPTFSALRSEYGLIYVNTSPKGAEVTVDGVFRGTTPTTINTYTTENRSHQMLIRMRGYKDYIATLSRNSVSDETIHLQITLVPITEAGNIKVTSTPDKAIAILDGRDQNLTPCTFYNLIPGTHGIQVVKEGYQPYFIKTLVLAENITNIHAQLTHIVSYGTIDITSTPSEADIYLDGIYQGQTPSMLMASIGTHFLTLNLSGYQTWNSEIEVNTGEQTQISGSLILQDPMYGSIQVTSIPIGSSVYLNNDYYGQTPTSGYLDIPHLVPGSYTITIDHPQNQDYSGTITVHADQITTVNGALQQPSDSVPLNCSLCIQSNPVGSMVFLDDLFNGVTPITLPYLQPGNHTITLKMNGYSDTTRQVNITGGSSLFIEMDPILPPTPELPVTPTPTKQKTSFSIITSVLGCITGIWVIKKQSRI